MFHSFYFMLTVQLVIYRSLSVVGCENAICAHMGNVHLSCLVLSLDLMMIPLSICRGMIYSGFTRVWEKSSKSLSIFLKSLETMDSMPNKILSGKFKIFFIHGEMVNDC